MLLTDHQRMAVEETLLRFSAKVLYADLTYFQATLTDGVWSTEAILTFYCIPNNYVTLQKTNNSLLGVACCEVDQTEKVDNQPKYIITIDDSLRWETTNSGLIALMESLCLQRARAMVESVANAAA